MMKAAIGIGAFLWLVFAMSPLLVGQAPPPKPLTTLEQNIATRCELLFGEGARPHALFLYHADDLEWLEKHAAEVVDKGVGVVVIFKHETIYVNGGAHTGIPPVDGRIVWEDPAWTKRLADLCRVLDLRLFMYVHPKVLRDAGMSEGQIVRELRRHQVEHGIKYIYLDGTEGGSNFEASCWIIDALAGFGIQGFAHDTVQSNITRQEMMYQHGDSVAGRVDYTTTLSNKFRWRLTGENREVPTDEQECREWLSTMSAVTTQPGTIAYFKYGSKGPPNFADNLPQWRVDSLFANRTSTAKWSAFLRDVKVWEEAGAEYLEDPDAFVRALAEGW